MDCGTGVEKPLSRGGSRVAVFCAIGGGLGRFRTSFWLGLAKDGACLEVVGQRKGLRFGIVVVVIALIRVRRIRVRSFRGVGGFFSTRGVTAVLLTLALSTLLGRRA